MRRKKLRCRQRYPLADGEVDETVLFVQRREWEGMRQRVRGLLAEDFVDVKRKSRVNTRGGGGHGVIKKRPSRELRPGRCGLSLKEGLGRARAAHSALAPLLHR